MATTIDADDLRWLVDSGDRLALLDLRESKAVDAGHILESTNLPRREVASRLAALVPDPATPIVLYEDGDAMAHNVAEGLSAAGYRDVRVLDGGLTAWEAAGHVVTTGRNVPSKDFGELVQHHDDVPTVSPEELSTWMAERGDVVIFDIRTPEEHARETIPGSIHVPGFELPAAIDRYADEDAMVVVHCSGRTRSIIGTQTVRLTGREDVRALENGTMGWVLAGLTPDRGATRMPEDLPVVAPEPVRRRWATHACSVGVRLLAPARVATLLERGTPTGRTVQVIDARLRARYDAGHIPGARWVPSGQLVQRADDHLVVSDAVTTLVCDDGVRSAVAGYWLRRMGRGDIIVVEGGMGSWQAAGLPVSAEVADTSLDAPSAPEPVSAGDAVGDDSLVIVSVLGSQEHRQAHPAGAPWVSATWLERDLAGHVSTDAAVVLVGADDAATAWLAADARRAGWSEATWLAGGLEAWRAAGGAVEDGLPDGLDPDDHFPHPITQGAGAMNAYLAWEHELGATHT